MMARWVLALLLLSLPSLAHATIDWDDSFEYANGAAFVSVWPGSCSASEIDGGSAMALSTARAHSGSKSLKLTYVGHIDGGCFQDRNLNAATSDLYTRVWMYMENFTVDETSTKITRHDLTYPQADVWWGMLFGNAVIAATVQTQTTAENIYGGAIPQNQWVCLELHFNQGTPGVSNGVTQAWINGTMVMNRTDVTMLPAGATQNFQSYVRLYRQNGLGAIYYDEYATSRDAQIGCGSGPPPPPTDTQPPTTPTNFQITANGSATWNASTDNPGGSGVANYPVLFCTPSACTPTTVIASPSGTSTLVSATGSYCVKAVDNAGNQSPCSTVVAFTAPVTSRVTQATDSFARADNADLGSAWDAGYSTFDPCKIVSTRVVSTNVNTTCLETFNTVTPANDQWSQVTVPVMAGAVAEEVWALVRWANSPTKTGVLCYVSNNESGAFGIGKYTAGTFADIGTPGTGGDMQPGDIYRCEAIGTTFNLYRTRAGVETLMKTGTDGGIASGKTGLAVGILTGGTLFDIQATDFAMGGFGTPTPPTVTSLVFDATGFNETHTGSPASFHLTYGTNSNSFFAETVIPASSIIAGRYNITLPAGMDFACLFARDALGVETTTPSSAYQCVNPPDPAPIDHGPATGVLRQLGTSPWLRNDSGNALVMTGLSGTESAFYAVQNITTGGAFTFNYATGFPATAAQGHNFLRMWILEQTAWTSTHADWAGNTYSRIPVTTPQSNQMPYLQVSTYTDSTYGTGITTPVYDLGQFNQAFFDLVRTRVLAAANAGLTPAIMLFNTGYSQYAGEEVLGHPYKATNNVNAISCDGNANNLCEEVYLYPPSDSRVTTFQDAYVRKMVDTLNDIDGVVWEVTNEQGTISGPAAAWVHHIADIVTAYEATGGRKVHPVWISPYAQSVANILASTHGLIKGPYCDGTSNYDTDPPVNTTKIVFYDTDHTQTAGAPCGTEVSGHPWKSFTRGVHPIELLERESAGVVTQLKAELAQVQVYVNKMNLAAMLPVTNGTIIGTAYGVKNDCTEYLSFNPADSAHTIDLTACGGGTTFTVEYLDITTGAISAQANTTGGASRSFNPSGTNPTVVYLKLLPAPPDTTPPVISGCTINGQSSGSVLPVGTISATLQCLTNEAATLKYGPTAGVVYGSLPSTFTTTGGTTHSVTITGLTNGSSTAEYIRGIDGVGNANLSDTSITWTVGGQPDMIPPILSGAFPIATFPAGTTSATIGFVVNEAAQCRWDTTDLPYASMTHAMTYAGGTCSGLVTSGLSDGTSVNFYGRACDLAEPTANCTTQSIIMTVTVAAATTDTTRPSTVVNLIGEAISQTQALLAWSVATDNVAVAGYQPYRCLLANCSDRVPAGPIVGSTTTTISNLPPETTQYFCVDAIDTSNNYSLNCSNIVTVVTPATPDLNPPSNMLNLRLVAAYKNSVLVTSDPGTDDRGAVTTTIELSAAGCGNFILIYSNLALVAQINNLMPNTTYCLRGKFSDGTNLSVAYSNTLTVTTTTGGLTGPRAPLTRARLPRTP